MSDRLARRRFCTAAFLLSLRTSRIAPVLAASIAALSKRVHGEPITATLAVATAIAQMVAANNRSDGGLAAALNAQLQYQRIMSAQLLSIQNAMAFLVASVAELPERFKTILHEERLFALHAQIGQAVVRYQRELGRASTGFNSFSEWTSQDITRQTLFDINNQLDRALAEVERGRWLDPLTALYLPVAMNASLAVRNALGEQHAQLRAGGQRFSDLFDLIEDPSEVESSASELRSRQNKYQLIAKELLRLGYKVPEDQCECESNALLKRVAVEDYVAPQSMVCNSGLTPGFFFGTCVQRRCKEVPRRLMSSEQCYEVEPPLPGRNGPTQEFAITVPVRQQIVRPATNAVGAIGIRQYSVVGKISVAEYKASDFQLSSDSSRAELKRVDAPTAESRLAALGKLGLLAEAESSRKDLSHQIDLLNIETAQIGLCLASLASTATARQSLFSTLG